MYLRRFGKKFAICQYVLVTYQHNSISISTLQMVLKHPTVHYNKDLIKCLVGLKYSINPYYKAENTP